MSGIFAQARFPKPEFTTGYEYPLMGLEDSVFSSDWLKLAVYVALMAAVFFALYKMRSRKMLLLTSLLSVAVVGFFWKACPCPIGLTQNTAVSIADANSYYPFVYFAIFAAPIIAAIFFGRIFCGGACPMGAIQDLVNLKSAKVPRTLDSCLKLIPYLVLVIGVVIAVIGGPYLICKYDPFTPVFRQAAPFGIAVFSGGIILLSVIVSRPYCRYLCPYGVILKNAALLSKRSVLIAPKECVNCRLCENSCPNDAILPPQTGRFFESPETARRRIRNILFMIPLFMAVGGAFGYAAGGPAAKIHPTTVLWNDIRNNVQNDYTDAFYGTKSSVDDLKRLADEVASNAKTGFAIGGALMALFISVEILRSLRRRENTSYTVDMSNCLCCGRCYEYCPDQMRLNGKLIQE